MIKLAALFVLAAATMFSSRADAARPISPPSAPAVDLSAAPASLPPLPPNWPSTLELGLGSPVGEAYKLKQAAPFGLRYRYLAGGVNTPESWANWKRSIVWGSAWPPGLPEGAYVPTYIKESEANGQMPVFTYYEIRQSTPGASKDEAAGDYENLQNKATMTAYWNNLTRFFQQAGGTGVMTVLHVEPDLWGYMEQRAKNEDPSTVSAQVAGSGNADLAGLPDTMQGFARAVIRLRDTYAPNVLLAYHLSVWGTGNSLSHGQNVSDSKVDQLARQAASFYKALGADYDLVFAEFSDRDAAFYQYVNKDKGAHWWDETDYNRNVRFISAFVQASGKRVVMWQIPLGNTKMRAMNNTRGHYQDNRVEWLLGDSSSEHLRAYRDAGVIAFLFGGGATGTTCACDALKDGVTNPKAVNGNNLESYSADDDGGYLKHQAANYYNNGALRLDADPSAIATGP